MKIVTGARTDGTAQLPVVATLVRPGSKYKTIRTLRERVEIQQDGRTDGDGQLQIVVSRVTREIKEGKEKKSRKIRGQER